MNTYKYAFLSCNVIQDSEGNPKFDIPFQIYSQTIIENQKNHYCYLTNDLIGKEVVLYFAYESRDESAVKAFPGFIGDDVGENWKDIRKHAKINQHWKLKKKDAYATFDGQGVETKYDGVDKDDLIHPYAAMNGKGKFVEEK